MAAMKSFELVFLEIMVAKISTKLFRFDMTSLLTVRSPNAIILINLGKALPDLAFSNQKSPIKDNLFSSRDANSC
jgi:hypothetical protein